MNNIILIGYMGSGKTTIGKRLSNDLQLEFVDTDSLIEKQQNCKISEIFEQQGETYFRELETKLLEDLNGTLKASILSTGGGMPCKEVNIKLLKSIGIVIYLQVSKETVLHRLRGDHTRPLLNETDISSKIDNMLAIRQPIYERAAEYIINVDHLSVSEVVNRIKNVIN